MYFHELGELMEMLLGNGINLEKSLVISEQESNKEKCK